MFKKLTVEALFASNDNQFSLAFVSLEGRFHEAKNFILTALVRIIKIRFIFKFVKNNQCNV